MRIKNSKNLRSRLLNAFRTVHAFGGGILVSLRLISDNRGSIYSKLTEKQRMLAADYMIKLGSTRWWASHDARIAELLQLRSGIRHDKIIEDLATKRQRVDAVQHNAQVMFDRLSRRGSVGGIELLGRRNSILPE